MKLKIKYRTLVTKEQFAKLKPNRFYGIFAESSAGKTKMVKSELVEYCKEHKKTLLYLTHRDSLKLQTLADLEEEMKEWEKQFRGGGIVVVNYQAIEYAIKEKQYDKIAHFYNMDFIVCDEAHYFVKDSWNEQTDYIVQFLEEAKSIKILMTGTLKEIGVLIKTWEVEKLTTINRQNNNLAKIIIYRKGTDLIDTINRHASESSKVLSFVSGSSENVVAIAQQNGGSFICSKHNDLYEEHADKKLMDIVVQGENRKENGISPSTKLWATSVWNEGVNIIDPNFATVCSFYPRSSTEFIQQFARIRRSNIIGFIVAPTNQMLSKQIEKAKKRLKEIEELRVKHNNPKLLRMNEIYCYEHIKECEYIREQGYVNYVSQIYNTVPVIDHDRELELQNLNDYLTTLLDKKMFAVEQEEFKHIMFNNYHYRDSNRKQKLGITAFNKFLQDVGIKYKLINKREAARKSANYGKSYWKIVPQEMTQKLYIDNASKDEANAEINRASKCVRSEQNDKPVIHATGFGDNSFGRKKNQISPQDIKEMLTEEDIVNLLEHLDASPRYSGKSIQAYNICHGGQNPKLVYYNNSKLFHCYTQCATNYDVFSLIERVMNCSFKDAVEYVCSFFDINRNDERKRNELASSVVIPSESIEEVELPNLPKNILGAYHKLYPQMWVDEGISVRTMEEFNIHYAVTDNQIIIPHYDIDGNLVGIRARNLNEELVAKGLKYIPAY